MPCGDGQAELDRDLAGSDAHVPRFLAQGVGKFQVDGIGNPHLVGQGIAFIEGGNLTSRTFDAIYLMRVHEGGRHAYVRRTLRNQSYLRAVVCSGNAGRRTGQGRARKQHRIDSRCGQNILD